MRVVALRQRYERTPFVVAPLPNDFEFAVFRSPSEWFLADQRETPLSVALLRAIG